ncbi:MAG: hypothetical protein AAF456_17715 [Planctomycetota bacterium]
MAGARNTTGVSYLTFLVKRFAVGFVAGLILGLIGDTIFPLFWQMTFPPVVIGAFGISTAISGGLLMAIAGALSRLASRGPVAPAQGAAVPRIDPLELGDDGQRNPDQHATLEEKMSLLKNWAQDDGETDAN